MNSVLAIVVTYNREDLLKNCISHIKMQTFSCDLLVVNNASTDGTSEYLEYENQLGNLTYITTKENCGGAGGFKCGMKWAVSHGYDYVWIMDDDTMPQSDALEQLMVAGKLLNGKYGFLSSTVLWKDGTGCVMNHQKITHDYFDKAGYLKDGIIRIDQATFVSLLIPIGIIKEYGLPIGEYFIWNDDIEFTRRIAVRNEEPCYLVGKSQVVHETASNCGNNISVDSIDKLSRYRMAYRNELCTYRKEGIKGIAFYCARCGRDAYRILAHSNDKTKRMKAMTLGIKDGLLFYPKIELPSQESKIEE